VSGSWQLGGQSDQVWRRYATACTVPEQNDGPRVTGFCGWDIYVPTTIAFARLDIEQP